MKCLFCFFSQCKTYLKLFVDWLHEYSRNNEDYSLKREGVSSHGTFYALFQAAIYIITLRHKEILELKKGLDYLRNLNLDRLITSNLNPLKFCSDTVAANFASVSRYCRDFFEKKNLQFLPLNFLLELTNSLFVTPLWNEIFVRLLMTNFKRIKAN